MKGSEDAFFGTLTEAEAKLKFSYTPSPPILKLYPGVPTTILGVDS